MLEIIKSASLVTIAIAAFIAAKELRKIMGAIANLDKAITDVGTEVTSLATKVGEVGADVTATGTAIIDAIGRITTPGISEADVQSEVEKLRPVGEALTVAGTALTQTDADLKASVDALNKALNPPPPAPTV